MPFPWAAVAQVADTGLNILNSAWNRGQSLDNTKRTINANKELAEYAYSKDLEMWNLQNAYNSPQEQMKRFKEAGLNPNLIYGQGSSGNATTMPKYNAIRQDYSGIEPMQIHSSILGAYQDYKMKNAQIDNVREQSNLTKLKSATEAVRKGSEMYKRGVLGQQHKLGVEMSKYYKEYAKAQMEKLVQDLRNKRLAGDIRSLDVQWYKWLKSSGIVGQSLAPLLRMYFKN